MVPCRADDARFGEVGQARRTREALEQWAYGLGDLVEVGAVGVEVERSRGSWDPVAAEGGKEGA